MLLFLFPAKTDVGVLVLLDFGVIVFLGVMVVAVFGVLALELLVDILIGDVFDEGVDVLFVGVEVEVEVRRSRAIIGKLKE